MLELTFSFNNFPVILVGTKKMNLYHFMEFYRLVIKSHSEIKASLVSSFYCRQNLLVVYHIKAFWSYLIRHQINHKLHFFSESILASFHQTVQLNSWESRWLGTRPFTVFYLPFQVFLSPIVLKILGFSPTFMTSTF